MMLLKAIYLSATLLVVHVNAGTNLTWIGYCPFDIQLAPSDDPKSLDLTYTPTTNPVNPSMFDGRACVAEIWFNTTDKRGDVYLEEIEYKSNKKMTIETKAAWYSNTGPTLYEPVSVTGSDPVIARNTTWNSAPACIQNRHSNNIWLIYLQTKFSDAAVGPEFRLEQKARLRFGESTSCEVVPECDQLDIDQKFPACHGNPTGHPWDD